MRLFVLLVGIIISSSVLAAEPVAHQFSAGDPILANEINANFQELANRIEANSQIREVVGFSTATTTGGVGIKALNDLCNAEFTGSRICTTEEFANTINYPTLPAVNAWIRPKFITAGTGSTAFAVADVVTGIGNDSGTRITCNAWANNTSTYDGFFTNNVGQIQTTGCNNALNVACCR